MAHGARAVSPGILLGPGPARAATASPPSRADGFRFAHATDIHVTSANLAAEGWAAALGAINRVDPAPDFLVTGGDHVGDALEHADRALVEAQWRIYLDALVANNRLPVRPVLGNHDIWGWLAPSLDPATPGYGKRMALGLLGLERSYYAFDHGGWHFVVLDNIARRANDYVATLDPEQEAWLRSDLAANTRPVCVFSHIPLLSVCGFHARGHVKEDHWRVPDNWMHRDSMPLIRFLAERGTKLCVSGHLHMLDRVDFLGIGFVCNGSVCGRWWNGPYQEFAEGYGVFDLYPDGGFDHQYLPFGWDAVAAIARAEAAADPA